MNQLTDMKIFLPFQSSYQISSFSFPNRPCRLFHAFATLAADPNSGLMMCFRGNQAEVGATG
jgi:hypothetical protein